MSVKTLKTLQRTIHLVAAALLLAYLYAFGDSETWLDLVRFAVVPVLGVSGLILWQAPRVMRGLRTDGAGR